MDFTEIQPSKTYWYLLVVVYTVTGWEDAYSTSSEKATEVSRELAKDIIHWIRVPRSMGSDHGHVFHHQPGGQRNISCSQADLGLAHLVSLPLNHQAD
jgi:hypothetical protein